MMCGVGVSVWVVGCAGSRQCCIQHRGAADGRYTAHTPAVGVLTHTHAHICKNGRVCKRDLLFVHHHKHFTELTYIAYYPVQWSVCRSPFQLPFAACCINEILIFVLKNFVLQFPFRNRVAQISWSTVQGKHSAINTQYNEHIVQWGVWGVQSSQQLSQTSHLASDGGCMMGRWNRF